MTDVTFPRLHGRPPVGWVNDPNGLCRVDGRWHVFFQHNPASPVHGEIAWGHLSSDDLLHWRVEPIALSPRPGEADSGGCWSGCVTIDHDVPTALYTATRAEPTDAWALTAVGDPTLTTWTPGLPVVAAPDDPEVTEVRDPFVVHIGGRRHVVQGAGHAAVDGRPQVLLYAADDLQDWRLLGPLLTIDDPVAAEVAPAAIWECPNLFELDGRWVLIVSLLQVGTDGSRLLSGVRWFLGDLDTTSVPRFVPERGGVLDDGPAFYAPQVLVEPDRVLLWGWAWELDRTNDQVRAAGWAGSLTFARELALKDERLVCRPAAELTGLRRRSLDPSRPIGVGDTSAFEVIGDGGTSLWLQTRAGEHEVVGAGRLGDGPVRLLVDGSVVEAFGPDGSLTTRAYPQAGDRWQARGATACHALGLESSLS